MLTALIARLHGSARDCFRTDAISVSLATRIELATCLAMAALAAAFVRFKLFGGKQE